MLNPLTLFSTVKSGLITVAVIAGLTFCGVLWWQKRDAENEVLKLRVQNESLQTQVIKKQFEVDAKQIAINVLQDTYAKIAKFAEAEGKINEGIDNAPPEKDGPVADVLSDALDGVGRMLANP